MSQQDINVDAVPPVRNPLDDVKQRILASLYSQPQLARQSRGDRYFAYLLSVADTWGSTWLLKLIWLPLDEDFIRLAYRLILRREPDMAGFSHLQTVLLTKTATRLDVAVGMMRSPEVAESRHTVGYLPLLLTLRKIAKRISPLNYLVWTTWRALTSASRARRIELQQLDTLDEVLEMKHLLSDTLGYQHNDKRAG